MNKNMKILMLTVGATVFFSGCANNMQPQPEKTKQPKIIVATKIKKEKYVLKDDVKIKHAVALLITEVAKIKSKCCINSKSSISAKTVKTPYDKVILNFIKKK